MKSFKEIRESAAFNDPPTILTMRRSAIRMLPGKQSVAVYKNENLGLEVAFPYTPGKIGRVVKGTGVAEEVNEMRDLGKDSRKINAGLEKPYSHLKVKENDKAHRVQKKYAAWTVLGKNHGDKKGKAIATLIHPIGTKFEETIHEAMSPELKRIKKERTMFKRDLSRHEDRFEDAKTRLDWAKKALLGHIKKYGKTLRPVGENVVSRMYKASFIDAKWKSLLASTDKSELDTAIFHWLQSEHEENGQDINVWHPAVLDDVYDDLSTLMGIKEDFNPLDCDLIDELSKGTLGSYIKKASKDAADDSNHHGYKTGLKNPKAISSDGKHSASINNSEPSAKETKRHAGIATAVRKLTREDYIMEATIHAIHAINRTQHPAPVRFRDGSTAMIDHPTAAQIMKLHSKVNRLNKKKIESMINSGPSGIKKVTMFIKDHMK